MGSGSSGNRGGSRKKALIGAFLALGALTASGVNAQIISGGNETKQLSIASVDGAAGETKHRQAFVNGVRLHYLYAGKGPAVVLLHGWANTAHAWRHVIPALASRYTVIAPDLRGMGDSSKPLTGYDRETVAKDILDLLDQLGVERALVVGHDLGARVGFELAAHHPERVSKLVVLDGVVPGRARRAQGYATCCESFGRVAASDGWQKARGGGDRCFLLVEEQERLARLTPRRANPSSPQLP
jgi:pimeloyl-ACP methyl ester carboxylesterase